MKNPIFHNREFEIKGISVPEFRLKNGKLIRIYIPNFSHKGLPLDFDLTIELIKRFQIEKSDFPWAKNYSQSRILEFLNPLTVKNYLMKKMRIDIQTSNKIVEAIGVNLKDKFENLSFRNKKALIIKSLFEKNDCIILDYYGVGAAGIEFLERIVNEEIEKGKSAIAFDKLEYAVEKESYENIEQIKIKVPSIV